ncbi:MAG TPA: DNA-3-methyladenine glycosylase I [Planctomycetes bacterium]|nr:DNA-3-methyladenine glycosylase I [Planctomycetota bacterium]
MSALPRCGWAKSELAIRYHDEEWGTPVHDDRTLFEFLILEGAQAGLSWETVLQKRARYREVFDDFDPEKVARYTARKVERLLADPGIIRNRLKIASAITNARIFLDLQEEFGSFDAHLWDFVDGTPIRGRWKSLAEIPARTDLSDRISKEWKRRGLKFVGSTIVYAYLQGVGVVNDHIVTCFRHDRRETPRRRKA